MKKHHKHKNKFIKKQKHKAQKAFGTASTRSVQTGGSSAEILATPAPKVSSSGGGAENSSFKLPIAEIKKDLLGTIIFAVFAVAALIVMHLNNFGFTDVQNWVLALIKF
ncbi:hypothetical protein A3K42_01155 [candidate division WWE3 bacterium RBG_13_37_7]|uniref:Uncharacterized protein n=1 Tax=candidate division WWE3 bacterium RBG_13_37_7 TaxID=1802609 RepID=A0A1F4U0Y7_UNCKA|nr:MAG: hypothetical protein A3K42_01155 [candidate division WWE3 bacterium RBG_13_37_7]